MAVTETAPTSRRQSRGPLAPHRRQRGAARGPGHEDPLRRLRSPSDRHLSTLAFLVAGLARSRRSASCSSAWRWQRVLAVFDVHVPLRTLAEALLRRPVRRERAARRRSAATCCASAGLDHDTGSSEVAFAVGRARTAHGSSRCRCSCSSASCVRPSLLDDDHAWIALVDRGRHAASLLAVILVLAGHPRLAGRFAEHENWMRFIGAVHVGVDRLRHDPRDAVGVLVAARRLPAVGRRVGVLRGAHARRRDPERRPCSRSSRRSRWPGDPDLGRRARRARRACSCCCSTRSASRPVRRSRIGLLWYAMMLRREPARRAGVRGRPHAARSATRSARRRHADRRERRRAAPSRPRATDGSRAARVLRDGSVLYWWAEIVVDRRLLLRVLGDPERQRGQHRRRRSHNATRAHRLAEALGINHEEALQDWALHFKPLIIACNYFYGSLHFVVTTGVMIYLFRKWSDDYPLLAQHARDHHRARAHRLHRSGR